MPRAYSYVGPLDILQRVAGEPTGTPIRHHADLQHWVETQPASLLSIPATFIVDLAGVLLLAERRSEHVVCAGGHAVLAAGEVVVERGQPPFIAQITNQSTGYCPEPDSWESVQRAIQHLPQDVMEGFSPAFTFRRCPACTQINVVKDDDFECSVCGCVLPQEWNF